jgi:P-type E1-E2 ATPase
MSNMTRLAIGALVAIAVHLILKFVPGFPHLWADYPLYLLLAAGAVQILPQLARNLWQREFGSDFLAGISIVTAVLLKEYLVASIVVLMLSGGTALEQFGTNRASQVLNLLAKRVPSVAHRKGPDRIVDIQLQEVAIGDHLVILPHEICPADGVVLEGQGSMNEAYLTGEPFEVPKAPGAQVISGSINGNAAMTVRAEKLPADSRYASIMRVMEETQQRRPQLRRIGDSLGAWYTPLAVGIALLAWALSGESARFLAVLVVATPCPLLIGIPVGVLGAISLQRSAA